MYIKNKIIKADFFTYTKSSHTRTILKPKQAFMLLCWSTKRSLKRVEFPPPKGRSHGYTCTYPMLATAALACKCKEA